MCVAVDQKKTTCKMQCVLCNESAEAEGGTNLWSNRLSQWVWLCESCHDCVSYVREYHSFKIE